MYRCVYVGMENKRCEEAELKTTKKLSSSYAEIWITVENYFKINKNYF